MAGLVVDGRRGAARRAIEGTEARAAACRDLSQVAAAVIRCEACPRLREYCMEVARHPVRRFADWTYWGRPVPGFGDPAARILIVGLAPAAHGANRTGRMFTGDRSGDFLYAALHRAGLCSQAWATRRDDGLSLRGVYISAAARCAPPANKPTPQEVRTCRPYLLRELDLLPDLKVAIALGAIGHDTYLRMVMERGSQGRGQHGAPPRFRHGALHRFDDGTAGGDAFAWAPPLLDSYHVSQQNTFTGRLTPAMMDEILARARALSGL